MTITRRNEIIDEVTQGIYQDFPVLLEKFGERGVEKCREDNGHHLKHLETALFLGNPQSFIDYAHWLDGILTSRGMATEHLVDNFCRLQNAFTKHERANAPKYNEILESAIHSLKKGNDS
ncbi:hypothetical protein WQ57_15640 [Mesobacillus campisalis]|uniref:Uncharacterized protein n=1 Tax=Mesobacillus campisalis TaxID=1408103 RepID=A0A0M2SX08_9BACI|nr:hypothetical protein [Mesobacillus campisalis]KKK37155.1 hypothetical protein WQ57_15640 [Mesobacillus campisalis]